MSGFAAELSTYSGNFAVDAVLRYLGLQLLLTGKACTVPALPAGTT